MDELMHAGLRTHRSASLRVAEPEALPADMRAQVRELVDVRSTNPRKGHASGLMFNVCHEADKAWLTLIVAVRPFAEGMTMAQLQRWYGKHGFVEIQHSPCLMARSPVMVPKLAVYR
jgi:hypothetical protein